MMDRAISVVGVPIRLTYERWFHIVENHDDVAGYYDLNVAGKSCPVSKHTEKQQMPRRHGCRDPAVVRVGRTHLPVAYPRSDLTSLRYPSPPRLRSTGRLTPV
jgi:hypothetical protein